MPTLTLLAIRNKIKDKCDLHEEAFIDDTELNEYINDAIRNVESSIHDLSEDYFLTNEAISFVSGTSEYALPADIYANKIRFIQYDDGAKEYAIGRIRDLAQLPYFSTNDDYSYILTNDATNGFRMKMYPTVAETSTNATIWYVRNAKELSSDTDVCDIPEFIDLVYWMSYLAVWQKEGSPMITEGEKMVLSLESRMLKALSERVPDDDNKVVMDTSIYEEMS